jgi:hypothetical protein
VFFGPDRGKNCFVPIGEKIVFFGPDRGKNCIFYPDSGKKLYFLAGTGRFTLCILKS